MLVRYEPPAVPDAEEPVPVGALPDAVGVAPALEPALLMQLSTQDYFSVSKMIDNWSSLKITYLVVGVVSCSAISLGAIGNAIGNGIGLVTLRDTLRSAAVVAGGAWSGELLVYALINSACSKTHKLQDKPPRWIELE
jgi:hypothetical protein